MSNHFSYFTSLCGHSVFHLWIQGLIKFGRDLWQQNNFHLDWTCVWFCIPKFIRTWFLNASNIAWKKWMENVLPSFKLLIWYRTINLFPPGQNGQHLIYDIFKYIFMNENYCILIRVSLKFVPEGPIENTSALVQEMAWHKTGDKPLPEAILAQ